MQAQQVNWYDYPQYYDMAFRDETRRELEFFEAAFQRYAGIPVRHVLEPACGSGRLVTALARRGFKVTGFDLSQRSLDYLAKRLKRVGVSASLFHGDMRDFETPRPADAAICTMNSFRHLLGESDALSHLRCVARAVRPGGLYILGLHLLPPDADEECVERWTASHAGTKVTTTLRVLETNRRKRLERIRINLRVRSGTRDLKLRHDFEFRMYTATQFRRLLAKVPEWEISDVFDFWYDIDDPLPLNDEISDTVCVLRRR